MKAKILINRIKEGDKETLGHGSIYVNNVPVFEFCTLELPNLHNQTNISSIPANKYAAETSIRPSGKEAIYIKNVPGRSSILIHVGNYNTDIKGCILVGSRFNYINGDDIIDIQESTNTMNSILEILRGLEFTVEIRKTRS